MIEYVLIDLDGTLLDFNNGERNAFKETINHFSNYELKEEDYKNFSLINDFYFNEYSSGKMLRKEFHYHRFEEIFKYLNLDCPIEEANKFYIESLKYQAILFDDVIPFLDYLKNKYKLFVASNGMNEVQIKRLELAHILNYFDNIYVSEKIGFNKPDIRFFEYIIDDIKDYDKSKYIIIGDRLDSDIKGGIDFGIDTVFLDRNSKFKGSNSKYNITKLEEIKKIL